MGAVDEDDEDEDVDLIEELLLHKTQPENLG